jgi:hypothetical protein
MLVQILLQAFPPSVRFSSRTRGKRLPPFPAGSSGMNCPGSCKNALLKSYRTSRYKRGHLSSKAEITGKDGASDEACALDALRRSKRTVQIVKAIVTTSN